MRQRLLWAWTAVLLLSASTMYGQAHPKDAKGSADHPLFPTRMPGYQISNHQQQGFASYTFRTKPPRTLEGKYTRIGYYLIDAKTHPGGLAIRRNYENAIKAAGGEVVHSDDNISVVKAVRDGVEVWAEIQAGLKYTGRYYYLHILETGTMQQVITADAMGAAIDKDGLWHWTYALRRVRRTSCRSRAGRWRRSRCC